MTSRQASSRIIVICSIALVLSFVNSDSLLAQGPKLMWPMSISVVARNVHDSSVHFDVICKGARAFTAGRVTLTIEHFQEPGRDTVSLWSGDSKGESFERIFTYQLPLPIGSRAHVSAMFSAALTSDGRTHSATVAGDQSVYHLADTLLCAPGEFGFLDYAEAEYLLKKHGYESKTDDELQALDRTLWKRIQLLKHGRSRGTYKK